MRALYYHGTVDRQSEDDHYAGSFVPLDEVAAHVAELARTCRPVALAEVVEADRSGRSLPDNAVHVSVDDGFRSTLPLAEQLARHRIPWTLFVITDAVLDGYHPVYVRLADALSASTAPVSWRGEGYDLRARSEKQRLRQAVKSELVTLGPDGQSEILRELVSTAGIEEPETSRWPFLSLDEVRELHGDGVEIASHSATHPHLTACSPAELDREVVGSGDRLAEALGAPVRSFSYPDGRFDTAVLRRVGARYDAAVATESTVASLAPFAIRRHPAGRDVAELRAVLALRRPLRSRVRSMVSDLTGGG